MSPLGITSAPISDPERMAIIIKIAKGVLMAFSCATRDGFLVWVFPFVCTP